MTDKLSIQIDNISSNKNTNDTFIETNTFLIKRNKSTFLISTHGFLPIKNNIQFKDEKLKICINSKWNELLILKSDNVITDLRLFKKLKLKIPNNGSYAFLKGDKVTIEDKVFANYAFLPNYPQLVYIKIKTNRPSQYLSGTPLSDNTDSLVGVVSFSDKNYVYCLPSYYITKTFEKKNNILLPEIDDTITRINRHYVKNNMIYNPYLGLNIPLSAYLLLEADRQTEVSVIRDNEDVNIFDINFIEYSGPTLIENSRKLIVRNKYYELSTVSLHLLKKYNPELSKKVFSQLNEFDNLRGVKFRIKNNEIILR
jgi:hypothetical protein